MWQGPTLCGRVPSCTARLSGGDPSDTPFLSGRRFWTGPWGLPPEPAITPQRVQFFLERLAPGTTTVSYRAVAVTTGHFVLPPAKASVQGQPELMGLSAGGEFWVLTTGQLVPATASAAARRMLLAAPKRCPNDCRS